MKGTQRGGSTGMTGGVAWRRAATRAQRRRGGAGRRAGGNGPGRKRTLIGTRGRSRRDPRDGQRAGESRRRAERRTWVAGVAGRALAWPAVDHAGGVRGQQWPHRERGRSYQRPCGPLGTLSLPLPPAHIATKAREFWSSCERLTISPGGIVVILQ